MSRQPYKVIQDEWRIHSLFIPDLNGSHRNTSKKLAHSSSRNSVNSKHNQAEAVNN